MIGAALSKLHPTALWRLADEPKNAAGYTTFLEWHGSMPAPTWDEVQASLIIVAQEQARRLAEDSRRKAYLAEADPLFFKAQRGEATIEEWNSKVAEIRNRFPYLS